MTLPHHPITPIPNNEPEAVPSLWNTRYEEIDANFANLDGRATAMENEVAAARAGEPNLAATINAIITQIGGISGTLSGMASPVSVQRAVGLDWLYRNRRIAFELFAAGYRLVPTEGVSVVSGIGGDESLDVASTEGLKVGQDYLLVEGEHRALVRIAQILTSQRARLTANLSRTWSSAALLTGMSLVPQSGGGVRGQVGDAWVSREMFLGDDNAARAVIIRRSLNAGAVRLYYRDAYTPAWAELIWSLRRQGEIAGVPDGYCDDEYLVPMRGNGYLRIEIDGEPVDILHIVATGSPTGTGGAINPAMRPDAPVIGNPANGATNVGGTPTLAITGYSSPAGNTFATAQFQVSTSNTFATLLHDSGEVAAQSYTLPAGVLAVNTTYYVRARVKDTAGLTSDWSAISSFTTKTSFAYVNTPSITSPTNGQTDIPEQPTIISSPFAVTGGTNTHQSSQWQIRLASGSWSSPVHDSGETTTALTSYVVPKGVLQAGQTQYVLRVRHKGATLGWSEWSSDVTITTKQQFAAIIGLVQAATGGGAGTYVRIDENFAPKTTDAAFFNNHPTYAGIIQQAIDGQSMIKIPKFYFKAGTVPSGTYAGKAYWMISDQPAAGFSVHPAFIGAGGVELDQIWVGKYQASSSGGKLQSVPGVLPRVSLDFPTARAEAYARNVSGVSGFRLWSYYDLAAIQMLATIEMGGLDMQALIGQGRVSQTSAANVDAADVAQAAWRGIVGLWGNVWQMVDGIKRRDGNWWRWQYNVPGNTTTSDFATGYVNTGRAALTSAGYPVTFDTTLLSAGIIVPATVDGPASNGSTGDYFWSNTNTDDRIAYHGGLWGHGGNAGLFCLTAYIAPSRADSDIGCRLAKA
ncbi:MAG: Ig-like domain-containing protein [Tepidimonas taiwanensis]|nr:Ig-like domain-containing protein [Tepidimonas taiwanensis]